MADSRPLTKFRRSSRWAWLQFLRMNFLMLWIRGETLDTSLVSDLAASDLRKDTPCYRS
jgi:hypothetical protein